VIGMADAAWWSHWRRVVQGLIADWARALGIRGHVCVYLAGRGVAATITRYPEGENGPRVHVTAQVAMASTAREICDGLLVELALQLGRYPASGEAWQG